MHARSTAPFTRHDDLHPPSWRGAQVRTEREALLRLVKPFVKAHLRVMCGIWVPSEAYSEAEYRELEFDATEHVKLQREQELPRQNAELTILLQSLFELIRFATVRVTEV